MKKAAKAVSEVAAPVLKKADDLAGKASKWLKNKASDAVDDVKSGASKLADGVKNTWNKLFKKGADKADEAAKAAQEAASASGVKTVNVNGKNVIRDNSTFDPNTVDKYGRTNVERMKQGLAPIGTDGKSVNIHHVDQTNDGTVMEITATNHQQNYSKLHTNTGQAPSQINRTDFDSWRRGYWKWRSGNLD